MKTTCFGCQRAILQRHFCVMPAARWILHLLINRGITYELDHREWSLRSSNQTLGCLITWKSVTSPDYQHPDRAFPHFSWDPRLNNMSSKRWVFPCNSLSLLEQATACKVILVEIVTVKDRRPRLSVQTEEDITGLNTALCHHFDVWFHIVLETLNPHKQLVPQSQSPVPATYNYTLRFNSLQLHSHSGQHPNPYNQVIMLWSLKSNICIPSILRPPLTEAWGGGQHDAALCPVENNAGNYCCITQEFGMTS